MSMTLKGLKMNISKCLKQYDLKKSEEITTKIRGQHEIKTGYRFMEKENNETILYWHDESLPFSEKFTKVKSIYEKLELHGFAEYIELKENEAEICLKNYRG